MNDKIFLKSYNNGEFLASIKTQEVCANLSVSLQSLASPLLSVLLPQTLLFTHCDILFDNT